MPTGAPCGASLCGGALRVKLTFSTPARPISSSGRLHIGVPNARVNEEINPVLGATLKPISDFGWQFVCGDRFVAKIHLSATRDD